MVRHHAPGIRQGNLIAALRKTTGEFRCDKSGVLLVSEEDPDSNVSEEKVIERKARPSGWSK